MFCITFAICTTSIRRHWHTTALTAPCQRLNHTLPRSAAWLSLEVGRQSRARLEGQSGCEGQKQRRDQRKEVVAKRLGAHPPDPPDVPQAGDTDDHGSHHQGHDDEFDGLNEELADRVHHLFVEHGQGGRGRERLPGGAQRAHGEHADQDLTNGAVATNARFRGIQLLADKVNHSNLLRDRSVLPNAEFIQSHVLETDFTDGDVFYMYYPFAHQTLDGVLKQLKAIAKKKRIRVVAYWSGE